MLAVWKSKPEKGLEIREDTEVPKIKPNEVLVKVGATSICGTDKHIYEWDKWAQERIAKNLPYILGHEVSGEVVEVGEATRGIKKGDRVSAETHIACWHCFQCKTGNAHICENVKILGVDVDGTFAEYVAIPWQNAWVNDPSLPHWIATAQEPLGNAVHTVFDGEVAGKSVVIFGAGPIGVCAAGLCHAAGAEKVIVVDPQDYRLKFAEDFGADVLLKPDGKHLERIKEETGGRGPEVMLEISGSPHALRDGLEVLRPGGRVSILGIFKEPVQIDVTNNIVFKGAKVHGINGRKMFDSWYNAAAFLKSGKLDLGKLVTHRLKLTEIEKGFEALSSGEAMKIVLEP